MFNFVRESGRVDTFNWPYADGVAIASVVCLFNRKRNHRWTKKKWYRRRPHNTHTRTVYDRFRVVWAKQLWNCLWLDDPSFDEVLQTSAQLLHGVLRSDTREAVTSSQFVHNGRLFGLWKCFWRPTIKESSISSVHWNCCGRDVLLLLARQTVCRLFIMSCSSHTITGRRSIMFGNINYFTPLLTVWRFHN